MAENADPLSIEATRMEVFSLVKATEFFAPHLHRQLKSGR